MYKDSGDDGGMQVFHLERDALLYLANLRTRIGLAAFFL